MSAHKKSQSENVTAAILAIGDELLSGRTRDQNVYYLTTWLTERGIELRESRIVGDRQKDIADALNALRDRYDYVFTSGGIGPTHDDITVDAIASALGVEVIEHPEAAEMIRAWYTARGIEVTPARMRMARAPEGAVLIKNSASGAPGVKIENIFVLAGVPRIFQTMLQAIDPTLKRGAVMHSCAVTARGLPESVLADELKRIQEATSNVSLGSYPIDGDELGVTIVARSQNENTARESIELVMVAMRKAGAEPIIGDRS